MLQINTNDVGFDPSSLGFPSVRTCQAIVLQTWEGLYGFHDGLTSSLAFSKKADAYKLFIQNMAMNFEGNGLSLIGVIRGYTRWPKGADEEWKAELLTVATLLDYEGPVYGVRLTSHFDVKKDESTYIRVDRALPHCSVKYKRMSKMGHIELPIVGGNLQHLEKGQVSKDTKITPQNYKTIADEQPWETVAPLYNWSMKRKVKKGSDLLRDDEGRLNVVPEKQFVTFRS